MKRNILSLALLLAFIGINAQENTKQSPFVGTWDWTENIRGVQNFMVYASERNDSILITMGGVFRYGNNIHVAETDDNNDFIPIVRVAKKNNKIIRSKISESTSNFFSGPSKKGKYNDVTFELLNDTTMLFILDDNCYFWPDTALLIRRDNKNRKFSQEENKLLYKKEVE